MKLQERIDLVHKLGRYISSHDAQWLSAKETAYIKNSWFIPEFIELATQHIATEMLEHNKLIQWVEKAGISEPVQQKQVGLVMAGNIPLVGFHDFLCVFLSGHQQMIKTSSKDDVLIRHLVHKMIEWQPTAAEYISFSAMLKGCDAYIATGSDNSARYFDYYFGRYPHIIRKNRTSVAILTGQENEATLTALADDIMQYFGLGCRNITQIYVPEGYDFVPLLQAIKHKYGFCFDHNKYRNNYDYQLAIYIMNQQFYMTNDCLVLIENPAPYSPIGTLHYQYYTVQNLVYTSLENDDRIQLIVGEHGVKPGEAQKPACTDYADGMDTMAFLKHL